MPAWAKENKKPSYTASEVGADPTGAAAAALKTAKEYTDKQIAAIPTPDVSGQISTHNTATDSHGDLRLLISGLTERLNALANSDDTTLDQMAEVVAYIKDNRELIEQVTTGKVSVSDIVDNLTTNVSDKPLSAAQGVFLKSLIDAIVIPTKVSAFDNDSGYLTEHQDLSDYAKKTELPTVPTKVSALQNDAEYVTKPGVVGVSAEVFNASVLLARYDRANASSTAAENFTLTLSDSLANYVFVWVCVRSAAYIMGSQFCPIGLFKQGLTLECNCINDQQNLFIGNAQYVSDTSVKGKVSQKAPSFEVYGVGKIG